MMGVFEICQKRQIMWPRLFDFCECADFALSVTFHGAANELGYLLCGKFHRLVQNLSAKLAKKCETYFYPRYF